MKYTTLLLISFSLFACKNQDEEKTPLFPNELYITEVNKKTGIRMYIHTKEIKDPAVINEFVAGNANFGVKEGSVAGDDKISFLSADTAVIGTSNTKQVITRSENRFTFTSLLQGRISSEHARLIYNMNKYRSELGVPWYDGLYRVDNLMVGYGDYSEIKLAVYNYKIVKAHWVEDYFFGTGPYLSRSVAAGKVFNEFDDAYIKSLTTTDTLAIEEYTYTFKIR